MHIDIGGTSAYKYYPNPLEKIVFSPDGPQPQPLFTDGQVKIIVVGLEAGQKIPVHPEGLTLFQFLEGKGVMVVDGVRLSVEAEILEATGTRE